MLAGVAMSNTILIVEFAHHLIDEGMLAGEAIVRAGRAGLRPVLDDITGDDYRADADGAEAWRGKRGLCAIGEGPAGRIDGICDLHGVHRARGLLPGVSE